MTVQLHQVTAALYVIAAIAASLGSSVSMPRLGRTAVHLLIMAVALHAVSFGALHAAEPTPPLTDFPVAVSFMALMGVLSFLLLMRRASIERLVVLVAPAAFLCVFYTSVRLPAIVPATTTVASGSWPHAHVVLGSAGLSLLGLAGLAGLLFLVEHRRLKAKRPARTRLPMPSLEALDRVNVAALMLGFPLLTLGVITGLLWEQAESGRWWTGTAHQSWSLIAWVVYVVLVAIRLGSNQGSRQAAVSALAGFALLFFAVIGLELFV